MVLRCRRFRAIFLLMIDLGSVGQVLPTADVHLVHGSMTQYNLLLHHDEFVFAFHRLTVKGDGAGA